MKLIQYKLSIPLCNFQSFLYIGLLFRNNVAICLQSSPPHKPYNSLERDRSLFCVFRHLIVEPTQMLSKMDLSRNIPEACPDKFRFLVNRSFHCQSAYQPQHLDHSRWELKSEI